MLDINLLIANFNIMKKYNIFKKVTLIMVLISTLLVACYPNQEKDWQGDLKTYPEITFTGFSPTSGYPGTEITLTGSNFGDLKQASRISFNGVEVPIGRGILSYSDTQIVVTVPELAGTGPISLNVWTHETVSATDFVYLPGVVINSLSPSTASTGENISIIGSNFGTIANNVGVFFNGGVEATIISITETEIVVEVPEGADNGPVRVTYDNGNRETVGPDFLYFNPSIVFEDFLETAPEFGGCFDRSGTQASGFWPSTKPTIGIGDREWAIHGNNQSGRSWGYVSSDSGELTIGATRGWGYDISSDPSAGYTKPTILTLEANFNLGNYFNNTPPRPFRGFQLGFVEQVIDTHTPDTDFNNLSYGGMYGIIITPDSNEIYLWDGSFSNDRTVFAGIAAVAITDFIPDYDRNADHNAKLVIDTSTGLLVSFELDGVAITFGGLSPNFSDANTNFMLIGGNSVSGGEMALYDVSFY